MRYRALDRAQPHAHGCTYTGLGWVGSVSEIRATYKIWRPEGVVGMQINNIWTILTENVMP